MANKKDKEFFESLCEQLGDKLEGMIDQLGLGDMSNEELADLLQTTFSDPNGAMKSMADKYYSYDAPDYSSMVAPVAIPFQPLVTLTKDKLPIVDKLKEVCTKFEPERLNKELLNVYYTLLNQFLENRTTDAKEYEVDDDEQWQLAMLITLYLLHENKCPGLYEAVKESLCQGIEFFIAYFYMEREDFLPTLIAEMGPDYLPAWEEFMCKRGMLFEMKGMMLMGMTHMVTVFPDSLEAVQECMARLAQMFLKTVDNENLFDETMLDTFAFCCIHTRCVDAKNALISLYSKYTIPYVVVDGGVNEVRKTIKRADLGVEELTETLDEFIFNEEDYRMRQDDYFDEDEDDNENWDGVDDEEDYDWEED